jgi:hypothetical protein
MIVFQQTSNEPYVRHDYKLIYADGHHEIYDDYLECQDVWFSTAPNLLSHVEVLDRKVSQKKSKGFK